jgi:hypothetical protein
MRRPIGRFYILLILAAHPKGLKAADVRHLASEVFKKPCKLSGRLFPYLVEDGFVEDVWISGGRLLKITPEGVERLNSIVNLKKGVSSWFKETVELMSTNHLGHLLSSGLKGAAYKCVLSRYQQIRNSGVRKRNPRHKRILDEMLSIDVDAHQRLL